MRQCGVDYNQAIRHRDEYLGGEDRAGACSDVGVPAKYGDIPNAYVRAEKEAHLGILLQAPRGMTVSNSTLREVGASHAG